MLLLFGGLDTVASMLGFIACFLAEHPPRRQTLIERIGDRDFLTRAVEEMLRRHGLSNIGRVVVSDCEIAGVRLRAGDRLLPSNIFVGLDARLNPRPMEIEFDREDGVSAVFGAGAHVCPGAALARRELLVFLEEWLAEIPHFRISEGSQPVFATGIVNSVERLELDWA